MPGATCAGCEIPPRLKRAAKKFRLTGREIQVLSLSSRGDCVKNIAENLGVSVRTVVYHRAHLLHKIGKPTMAAAVFELLFFGK